MLAPGDSDTASLPGEEVLAPPSLESEEPDGFPHDVFTESSPLLDATIKTEWGELRTQYRVVDGEALAEGDIVIPTELGTRSAAIVGRRWPGGVVPFVIDGNLPMSGASPARSRTGGADTPRRASDRRDGLCFRARTAVRPPSAAWGRQFVNLTTRERQADVVAIGVNHQPPSFAYFYRRGYATLGTNRRANAYRPHFRYTMPPGKAVSNLIDVAFGQRAPLRLVRRRHQIGKATPPI